MADGAAAVTEEISCHDDGLQATFARLELRDAKSDAQDPRRKVRMVAPCRKGVLLLRLSVGLMHGLKNMKHQISTSSSRRPSLYPVHSVSLLQNTEKASTTSS
jgi:hypothetical protein